VFPLRLRFFSDCCMDRAAGSIRQRGPNSWELRIYQGVDPATGKERWSTRTVRGSHRYASAQLAEFQPVAKYGRIRAGAVANLLAEWSEAASPGWAATIERETKSFIYRHLVPHLGHLAVAKLTAADVDDFYSYLLRYGGRDESRNVGDVELATLGWVHRHNNERLHGYLNDVPPIEFEAAGQGLEN
jgi:hypothetical protein